MTCGSDGSPTSPTRRCPLSDVRGHRTLAYGRHELWKSGISNEGREWPGLDVEVFSVKNLLYVLRNDFGTLGVRDGRHASHNLRYSFVPIDENVSGYRTSTEWMDDICPLHRSSNLD